MKSRTLVLYGIYRESDKQGAACDEDACLTLRLKRTLINTVPIDPQLRSQRLYKACNHVALQDATQQQYSISKGHDDVAG